MFEISCASCQASFEYNTEDYIHLCPFCSTGFVVDSEEGSKEIVGDHYIVPPRIQKEQMEDIFMDWISSRYHRPDKTKNEFRILGSYGIMLPYWVVSVEAHTFWSGHSAKANSYSNQSHELAAGFVREEGKFSRRYRWGILGRRSPKEHWGLERLHHPREGVMVDWDGFPFDEAMGKEDDGEKKIYDSKMPFKFEHAGSLPISGIQIKENQAIMRVRDQVTEFHRRIAKSKIGTLYEHRTEIEIIGIHVVHVPFWFVRYAFTPQSVFKYFTTLRERKILIQGYTKAILEAELPLSKSDKVMTNMIVCCTLAFVSLAMAVFLHPLLFLLFVMFMTVAVFSAWKMLKKEQPDPDLIPGKDNKEPA